MQVEIVAFDLDLPERDQLTCRVLASDDIEKGARVQCAVADFEPCIGIDDPADLRRQRDDLLAACVATRDWLLSFSVPPATTIREKEEVLATLRAAIAAARGA